MHNVYEISLHDTRDMQYNFLLATYYFYFLILNSEFWLLTSISDIQHVFHIVKARRLAFHKSYGLNRSISKGITAVGFVGQF